MTSSNQQVDIWKPPAVPRWPRNNSANGSATFVVHAAKVATLPVIARGDYFLYLYSTLLETNSSPRKIGHPERKFYLPTIDLKA